MEAILLLIILFIAGEFRPYMILSWILGINLGLLLVLSQDLFINLIQFLIVCLYADSKFGFLSKRLRKILVPFLLSSITLLILPIYVLSLYLFGYYYGDFL